MTSVEWAPGLELMAANAASLLRFKDVEMEPVMTKMLVIAPGGRLERGKHAQEDVARLLVQLPSVYSGGEFVVSENGTDKTMRWDFGSSYETTGLRPQYVVYTADATREVLKTTNGYRILVEYSLQLPNGKIRRPIDLLRTELVEAMKILKGEAGRLSSIGRTPGVIAMDDIDNNDDSRFALMISTSYSKADIASKGVEAFCEMDRDRFQLLSEANALLPRELEVKFYIAHLRRVNYGSSGSEHKGIVSWYLPNGQCLSDGTFVDWSHKLNFFNPGMQTLDDLLKCDGGGRFAVVGWAASGDTQNMYHLIGEFPATVPILAENPIDALKLRGLFHYAGDCQNSVLTRSPQLQSPATVTTAFCQKLCLVAVFLNMYYLQKTKKEIIPMFAEFVRKFGWYAVSASLLGSINGLACEARLKASLQLAGALHDTRTAQTALSAFALQKARDVHVSHLANSPDLELLWKHAVSFENHQVFKDVEALFSYASLLGPVVIALSKCINTSASDEHRAVLARLASRRRQWLVTKIAGMEKPFTWSIPVPDFPDAAAISSFLNGSNSLLDIVGFKSVPEASSRADLLSKKIKAPLEITAIAKGNSAHVRIKKMGGSYDTRSKKMAEYKAEMARLADLIHVGNGNSSATKRKRLRKAEDDELELM